MVGSADEGRRLRTFGPSDLADLNGWSLRRAAVSRCHGGDVGLPAVFSHQPDESAGAEELRVIRVSENGKGNISHGSTPFPDLDAVVGKLITVRFPADLSFRLNQEIHPPGIVKHDRALIWFIQTATLLQSLQRLAIREGPLLRGL